MAWGYEGEYIPLQMNVPASQEGKINDLVYQIYELDSTGAPGIYVSETNNGLMETRDGAYQVKYTFPKGNYSINWRIQNTPYVANEEIMVVENVYNKIDSAVDQISANFDHVYTGNFR